MALDNCAITDRNLFSSSKMKQKGVVKQIVRLFVANTAVIHATIPLTKDRCFVLQCKIDTRKNIKYINVL